MKRLIAFLMLAFMVMLVAPTQAMQAGDDCNVSYNIDNCNAPPGTVLVMGTQSEPYYFENCQEMICPEAPEQVTEQKTEGVVWYEAVSRSWLTVSKIVNYTFRHTDNRSETCTYRNPRDGL